MTGLPQPKHVRIVQLPPGALAALADGDLTAANLACGIELSPYLAAPENRGTWRRRTAQVAADPAHAAWITGAIWDDEIGAAVGRAGFHEPPDADGVVEVGYAVDPAYRRRGYARAALVALLDRAAREPDVRVVRASVRPDNVASYNLIAQYGFVKTGEQWDDEDGLEIIYETAAG